MPRPFEGRGITVCGSGGLHPDDVLPDLLARCPAGWFEELAGRTSRWPDIGWRGAGEVDSLWRR